VGTLFLLPLLMEEKTGSAPEPGVAYGRMKRRFMDWFR
jgi:hypothetical protein